MNWLQLELRTGPDHLPVLEDLLLASGAQALTLLSDANEPVLEPAPGETPLWQSVRIQALLPVDVDLKLLRRRVDALAPRMFLTARIDFVGEQDWQALFSNHAVDAIFAQRLWLRPKGAQHTEVPAGVTALYLEPGLAFGSGSHPTTRLCLEWIAENVRPGMRIVDFGCGSGILAVAAALLGAQVVAVDHDPQAVMATKDNAHYNGVTDQALVVLAVDQWHKSMVNADRRTGNTIDDRVANKDFDVVIANILAEPLIQLAQEFQQVLRPAGRVVLSGVLESQAQAVAEAYGGVGFSAPVLLEEWVRLDGVKQ